VSCKTADFRNEYVRSAGNMNCSRFNVSFMSRKGVRFGGGSSSSGFGVHVDNLSCIFNKVYLSVNRNPRRCVSNCAISLKMSSNPAVQVSSQSHSCGHSGSMLLQNSVQLLQNFTVPCRDGF